MQCELCGTAVPRTRRFLVEKTPLNVCSNCERFGTSLEMPAKRGPIAPGNVPLAMERRTQRMGQRDLYASESMQKELVEDYAERIRTAREKHGWTRQDLGGRVGEREVSLGHIESGALRPVDDVARKLERELGIILFEPVKAVTINKNPARGLTLGDMLRDAMQKPKDDDD